MPAGRPPRPRDGDARALLAQGLSIEEIAEATGVSIRTAYRDLDLNARGGPGIPESERRPRSKSKPKPKPKPRPKPPRLAKIPCAAITAAGEPCKQYGIDADMPVCGTHMYVKPRQPSDVAPKPKPKPKPKPQPKPPSKPAWSPNPATTVAPKRKPVVGLRSHAERMRVRVFGEPGTPIPEATPDECQRVLRIIACNAVDADDMHLLMDALGLPPTTSNGTTNTEKSSPVEQPGEDSLVPEIGF